MPLNAGRLDRRITIEIKTVAQDEFGQPVETWTTLATVWAHKRDIRASEKFRAQQEIAEEAAVFEIRWRSGIDAGDRLVHDGKTYDIEGVAEIGRREGLELMATAVRV
jgi:SPP1 family predicted phage head-tail adaptor